MAMFIYRYIFIYLYIYACRWNDVVHGETNWKVMGSLQKIRDAMKSQDPLWAQYALKVGPVVCGSPVLPESLSLKCDWL